MNFNKYQTESRKFAIYSKKDNDIIYPLLGLLGEAGELTEKIKRLEKDNYNISDNTLRKNIIYELGDILWYLTQLSTELDVSLDEIALLNLEKLKSRQSRNVLMGKGDNR
jgi:NTP pyrophosphatase (non-canonical NTP hydrolase)